MHVRVMTLRVQEGKTDEVVRVIRERVLPSAQRQPGFLGFVVTSDREARKIVGATYWSTEAEMLDNESREYFQEGISNVIALLSGPPVVEHHRVELMS